ncbi:hypothetical protein [Chryseobacterium sp. MEBOG07]|uniref:hypothetical protein n=1 Tax=Chryseobacterium sp. MEBOG07 TaxID=2879939 RepID=UPI001F3AB541|nr:hypothetical protein [Chryseobacterium sp. MEBOG07]UKB80841.1 hypothetical protein LF886_07570 [Chryseobacterium sp. MEBOG07]
MKEKRNNYQILLSILIIVHSLYICLSVFKEKVLLTDDLARVYELRTVSESYFLYIYSFLDSVTMAARPVSGLVTGTLFYLVRNNESLYFLGLLFFPLSLAVLYWVAKNIFSKELASLIILLYSISIIGTSIQFSPLMLNSNLATIFFALSIYYTHVRQRIVPSALFFIASVLSYEIFLPLILINLFMIKENRKKILFAGLTLGAIVIFRKVIQPNIFIHSYQRDDVNKVFEVKRVIFVIVLSLKMFFYDFFVGIYKGLLHVKKMNVLELIISIIMPFVVYKVFYNFDFKNKSENLKKLWIFSLIFILLGLSIFLLSSYIPTLFGFENRNLGAIRLFYTLFIISGVIWLSVQLKLQQKTISIFLSAIAFLFIITNISIKDSWIYAAKFNNELFVKLNTALKENNIETGNICLEYDVFHELKSNPNLTLREPLFYNDWEAPLLCEMNGIDPQKIHIYGTERESNCTIKFSYKDGKMTRTK